MGFRFFCMTHLVACLGTGKGTWTEVNKLIRQRSWEKVFLVTNNFGKENYKNESNAELIIIDDNQNMEIIRDILVNELKTKNVDVLDMAINFISGSGKEHMALLSALLKIGAGVRLVNPGESEVKEI